MSVMMQIASFSQFFIYRVEEFNWDINFQIIFLPSKI